MKLIFAFLLCGLVFSGPQNAYAASTSDPNHRGYLRDDDALTPVEWEDYQARCEECRGTVDSYNALMHALLRLRLEVARAQDEVSLFDRGTRMRGQKTSDGKKGFETQKGSRYTSDEEYTARNLNYKIAIETLRSEMIPALQQKIRHIEAMAQDMRRRITACERGCGGGPESNAGLLLKADSPWMDFLPFSWGGPYPEVCYKCAKLAQRLNTLPGLAAEVVAKQEANTAQQAAIRAQMERIRLFDDAVLDYTPQHVNKPGELEKYKQEGRRNTLKRLRELEKQLQDLERQAQALQRDLDAISRNFNQTLELYNKCVPTCPKKAEVEEEDKKDMRVSGAGGLPRPPKDTGRTACAGRVPPREVLTIGPNSQYGTGAQMKDKAADTAKGMALGAVGGLLGGKGIGLGGGGPGGSGSKGPKTDKDPTRGDYMTGTQNGIKLGMRGMAQGADQLLVSAKIFDAPSDGTFHAMWLSDSSGNIVLPKKYHIYEIYRDWQLSVWWTHDRWVNGEHVYHDEGKEITTGRVSSWYKGAAGVENSIWANMGFRNATKGINRLGAVFDTQGLNVSCPLMLTTYITQPGADPVTAVPMTFRLDFDDEDDMPRGSKPAKRFTIEGYVKY